MATDTPKDIDHRLDVIGRALARLCLGSEAMKGASQGRQAKLLRSLGLTNAEIAELLDTTANTISVRLAEEQRKSKAKKKAPTTREAAE